jgi:NADH dehydrogenase
VVGAGPTGVEIAGQIRELASRSLRGEFRSFDPSSVRVLLVDGGKEPLATFGDRLSDAASRELASLGVELKMNARVTNVDTTGVDVETNGATEHIAARTVVWAAGVQASPLAKKLADSTGADVDRAGRIAVLPDLTLPGHPEVFAVGDMVAFEDLPGVAEVAMQGGLHAANTIRRRLRGHTRAARYRYRDMGSVATIGRFRAVCSVRGLRLSGLPAWLVWMFVHIAFLNGFGSRFGTMRRWTTSMIGRARPERVFSVAHTGGDLSAPESVRAIVQPLRFPADPAPGGDGPSA